MSDSPIKSSNGFDKAAFLAMVRRDLYGSLAKIIGRSDFYLDQAKSLHQEDLAGQLKKIQSTAKYLSALMDSNPHMAGPVLADNISAEDLSQSLQRLVTQERKAAPLQANPLLVVDDRQSNRELLCQILEEQGHKVLDAENGEMALEVIRKQPFDLVLLDIMMPKMDGYQVLEALKADKELRHIPVIMLSGLDEINSVVRCIEMGAEDYLPKPFNPILLRARIDACLEKKRLRDQEQEVLKQLQLEQEKAESLLLNILPKPIADRLKQGENMIVDSFPEATVLFADLTNFTALSTQISPADLVHCLNEVFSRFDRLAEKHGVEKIKTIGDAYMVVGNLPTPRENHAQAMAEMALDMIEEMGHINRDTGYDLSIRIGINTGPVIAGIIGKNKFIYDLWGDTVNIASRMQSQGFPGLIQITPAVFKCVCDQFVIEDRGVMEIKGRGEMTTYALKCRK